MPDSKMTKEIGWCFLHFALINFSTIALFSGVEKKQIAK
jgi:hypothetical protein